MVRESCALNRRQGQIDDIRVASYVSSYDDEWRLLMTLKNLYINLIIEKMWRSVALSVECFSGNHGVRKCWKQISAVLSAAMHVGLMVESGMGVCRDIYQ